VPAQPGSAAPLQPEQSAPVPVVERIERLKPSQMLPDRFQPRRLAPAHLRAAFFAGKLDCYQVAGEWLALSKNDSGYRAEIERLLAMGGSFESHGQIKPVTGSWESTPDGRYVFMIETGERRFWAACLRAVQEGMREEPLLRVEVVSHPTRQRQVLENRHSEPPSAVGQACEVAALILSELDIAPDPAVTDDYDYFRQARAQRMPAGLWERIMPVMQLTRPRMVQLLNILHLPTPYLELADRYRLPERVLREIIALPREQWERVLRASIQNQLTSEEVAELAGTVMGNPSNVARSRSNVESFDPGRVAVNGLRRFGNALMDLDEISQQQALDEAADVLVATGQAEGMLVLLDELSRLVTARLARRQSR
jgi:hypothetical protein